MLGETDVSFVAPWGGQWRHSEAQCLLLFIVRSSVWLIENSHGSPGRIGKQAACFTQDAPSIWTQVSDQTGDLNSFPTSSPCFLHFPPTPSIFYVRYLESIQNDIRHEADIAHGKAFTHRHTHTHMHTRPHAQTETRHAHTQKHTRTHTDTHPYTHSHAQTHKHKIKLRRNKSIVQVFFFPSLINCITSFIYIFPCHFSLLCFYVTLQIFSSNCLTAVWFLCQVADLKLSASPLPGQSNSRLLA